MATPPKKLNSGASSGANIAGPAINEAVEKSGVGKVTEKTGQEIGEKVGKLPGGKKIGEIAEPAAKMAGTAVGEYYGGPAGGQVGSSIGESLGKGIREGSGGETESGEATDMSKSRGGLTSPEGVLMLATAALIDGIGFLFFIIGTWFGIDDYGILDLIGLFIVGGWMLLRSGGLNADVAKKGLRRFIKSSVVELIPFLGGASPTWTWLVYKTLKEGDK